MCTHTQRQIYRSQTHAIYLYETQRQMYVLCKTCLMHFKNKFMPTSIYIYAHIHFLPEPYLHINISLPTNPILTYKSNYISSFFRSGSHISLRTNPIFTHKSNYISRSLRSGSQTSQVHQTKFTHTFKSIHFLRKYQTIVQTAYRGSLHTSYIREN